MNFTPEEIQQAFLDQLDGREPYFYWLNLPPTKVWYEPTDNSFHTNVGISQKFDGYKLTEMCFCLSDLYDKLLENYVKKHQ